MLRRDPLPAGMETSFVGYKWALCYRTCMSSDVSHARPSARSCQAEVVHLFIDYHPFSAMGGCHNTSERKDGFF